MAAARASRTAQVSSESLGAGLTAEGVASGIGLEPPCESDGLITRRKFSECGLLIEPIRAAAWVGEWAATRPTMRRAGAGSGGAWPAPRR